MVIEICNVSRLTDLKLKGMDTISGEATQSKLCFVSLLNRDLLQRERICSQEEQTRPTKSRPLSTKYFLYRKANRKPQMTAPQMLSLLCENGGRYTKDINIKLHFIFVDFIDA